MASKRYREKEVCGVVADAHECRLTPTKVTVRVTNDNRGKSLSLSAFNVMIEIPLEEVEDLIVLPEGWNNGKA